MSKKGFGEIIVTFLAIVVGAIIVANVALPSAFTPTQNPAASVTGTGTMYNININTTNGINYSTTSVDNTVAVKLVLTYQGIATKKVNLTTNTGTLIATLSGTSPQTIDVSASQLQASEYATGKFRFNLTTLTPDDALTGYNVTASTLNYYQLKPNANWDTGTIAMWTLIGIVIVAVFILFIVKTVM